MTVGKKMHMALASIESAKASMEQFGLETEDVNAQKMYFEIANELGSIMQRFEGRINYAESQEPQYKVKQQAMNKKPNQS